MNTSQRTVSLFDRVFPTPKYLTLNIVALELSVYSVRIFKLKQTHNGYVPEFHKTVELKNPCPFFETGEDIEGCKEVKGVLQKLRKEFKFTYVTVSLPESKTYIFKTSVPKTELKDLRETLSFKIEENVPLNPSEVMFDFKVIDAKHSHNHVDVVVSALPREFISSYTLLLEESGLFPVGFYPESLAIMKSILHKDDDLPYLIINLNKNKIVLSIIEGQAVQYTSTFPISGKDVVVDFDGPTAHGFIEHINKLLLYWFTNQHDPDKKEKIQTAIIVGDYATESGLTPFLENKLKINIQIGGVWKNCFDINTFIPEMSHKESLQYATAIGLALHS